MSKESKEFLNDLFTKFKNGKSGFKFLHYECIDFEFPYVKNMAEFLDDMNDVSYDRKNAIIYMSTKHGRVYSVDEINKFNQRNKEDLEIIGVGNEAGALTHDPGCAVFKFQVNVNTYEKEVKELGYPDFKEKEIDFDSNTLLSKLKSKSKSYKE